MRDVPIIISVGNIFNMFCETPIKWCLSYDEGSTVDKHILFDTILMPWTDIYSGKGSRVLKVRRIQPESFLHSKEEALNCSVKEQSCDKRTPRSLSTQETMSLKIGGDKLEQ